MGTTASRRSNWNHARTRRRSVPWPNSVSAGGRLISLACTSFSHGSEVHIGRVEPPALRNHAQYPVTHCRAAVAQEFIEHDEDGCRARIAAAVEIRKPPVFGNVCAAHDQQVGDLAPKMMRGIVTEKMIDLLIHEHTLLNQTQSSIDPQLDHLFEQPHVLPDEQR